MFLVAKLVDKMDSVLLRFMRDKNASTPMTKERIFKLLSEIRELGFQTWTNYHADIREHATEHFIASDDFYVRVGVWERQAEIHVFSRETSHIVANRRYRWLAGNENAPVLACVWVTEEEMSYLKTLGATEQLMPNAAQTVYGNLIGWNGRDEFAARAEKFFGSLERGDELVELLREAVVDKLGITFET